MEESLALYITLLHREFSAYVAERLKELGTSFGQLPFLVYVGKHPGCPPSEVTARLGMDWGHAQRSITKLTEDGFLRKERTHPGARSCRLYLTDRGEEAFRVGHEVFRTWDSQYLGDLTPEERTGTLEVLRRLAEKNRKSGINGI